MKLFTKILAFILLLIWIVISIVACATIIGGILLFVGVFEPSNWSKSGGRLLDKILE